MSTKFLSPGWRMPKNANQSKSSNYSLNFDGGSYINVSDLSSIPTGDSSRTVSAWFNSSYSGTGEPVIISYGANANAQMFNIMLKGGSGADAGRLRFVGYNRDHTFTTADLRDSQWHHTAVTYNGTIVEAFLDGSSVGSFTPASVLNTGTSFFKIGHQWTNWQGQISQLCIFDYVLSPSQVTTLYGSSSTGIGNPMALTPKPVAYYPLGTSAWNGEYLVENNAIGDYVFGFNGINDVIDFGNLSVFEPTSNYTFSIWFNSGSYVYKTLFGDTSNAFAQGVIALLRSSSALDYYHNTTSTYKTLTLSLTDFPINTWHNLTITWSASTGILRGFIDGKFNAELTGVNDVEWGNISLELGRYYNTFYYDSKLSNFVMWDTTLTDGFSGTPTYGDVAGGQVAEVYNNGTPQTTITGTPIGWWKLDASATFDGSNWSIPDSSSNSNNGTMYGSVATLPAALQRSDLSFTSGYSLYAMNFDGIDDYILPGFLNSFITNDVTVSIWVNYTTLPSGFDGSFIGSQSYTSGLGMVASAGQIRFFIENYTSNYVENTVSLSTNKWYHFCGTWNGSTIELFVDGVSQGTDNYSGSITTSNQLEIGRVFNNSYNIDGKLSNMAIWNTGLTPAEVREIYNEGLPSNLNTFSGTAPVSWWQLGENSSYVGGWTFADEMPAGNNGVGYGLNEASLTNGVGTTANGISTGMSEGSLIGDAPYSTANAVSSDMAVTARGTNVP